MRNKLFQSRLSIGIPKQEKLKLPIIELLKNRGFDIEVDLASNNETGTIKDKSGDIPDIRVEFIRAADGMLLLEEGVIGVAIIGSDIAVENTIGANPKFEELDERLDLDIAKCSFTLAAPEAIAQNLKRPSDLNGLRIATSYPNMLQAWLQGNKVTPSRIIVREGGVESSIRMGIADIVADLVDTGSTLKRHNLKPIFNICRTSAICYTSQDCDLRTDMLATEFINRLRCDGTTMPTPSKSIDLQCA